jgi:class 3 adenylate cyclase
MSDLPSRVVTFLMTDIEGSTRLWEGAPDAMRAALAGMTRSRRAR